MYDAASTEPPRRAAASAATGRSLLALTCLVLLGIAGDALAAAGYFQFVAGDVRVRSAGSDDAVAAARGAEVQPGDTILTGASGVAQLRMVDGAQLSCRASMTDTAARTGTDGWQTAMTWVSGPSTCSMSMT